MRKGCVMKKLLIGSFVLLFASALCADDLAEAAKREKARREALKKQGKKATVLTNEDVKDIKSTLAIESNTPVEDSSTSEGTPTGEPGAAVQGAIDNSNAELEDLKRQKEELAGQLKRTSDSIDESGARSSNLGQQYREKRLKEEELRKIEQKIEQMEKQDKPADQE